MFKSLDPLFMSQLRLAIVSHLVVVGEADFSELKEKTGATAGNLSIQIGKLQQAGYLDVEKTYKNNYPLTLCRITKTGIHAFEAFYDNLKTYFDKPPES
jgi:predicted transcriptional regulator